MPIPAEIRTVDDNRGIPILEIIKERDALLICETNNLGRNIKIRSSAIPSLLLTLKALSERSEFVACDVMVDRTSERQESSRKGRRCASEGLVSGNRAR